MRAKQLKLIVTFHTTTSAMAMERICMEKGIPGRLIPVPRDITAGCGMSWCATVDARSLIEKTAKEAGIETDGWYELMV
jgi:hypothetical protein